MPDKNNIDVTVVVSGQPERLKVNVHQTIEHLIHGSCTGPCRQTQIASSNTP